MDEGARELPRLLLRLLVIEERVDLLAVIVPREVDLVERLEGELSRPRAPLHLAGHKTQDPSAR